jgi:hypothetical protein
MLPQEVVHPFYCLSSYLLNDNRFTLLIFLWVGWLAKLGNIISCSLL